VVGISGTLQGSDIVSLREHMAAVLNGGARRVILNFADLTYLDSAALGELVACQLRSTRVGASIKIAGAGRRMQDLLLLTRLITVFDAHDSLDAALASFFEEKQSQRLD
jgi:anti-sigma B factor antagonist